MNNWLKKIIDLASITNNLRLLEEELGRIARAGLRPVHWEITELRRRSRREGLPLLAAARQAEFASGLTAPAGIAFGQLAVLKLISRKPDTGAAAVIDEVLAASAVAQLHGAFQRVQTRSTVAAPLELTAKQTLCLRWSAEGKSMRAIATLEEMIYSAVAFHLMAARRTLDALSLPQATAIATKLRLM